jgi:hypothetical protein
MIFRSLVVCLVQVTLVGCNTLPSSKASPGKPENAIAFDRAAPSDETPALAGGAVSPAARSPAPSAPEEKSDATPAVEAPSSPTMIIRTGTASVEVDSLEPGRSAASSPIPACRADGSSCGKPRSRSRYQLSGSTTSPADFSLLAGSSSSM